MNSRDVPPLRGSSKFDSLDNKAGFSNPIAGGGYGKDEEKLGKENRRSLLKFLAFFAVALLVTVTVTCTAIWFMSSASASSSSPATAEGGEEVAFSAAAAEEAVKQVYEQQQQQRRKPGGGDGGSPSPPRTPFPAAGNGRGGEAAQQGRDVPEAPTYGDFDGKKRAQQAGFGPAHMHGRTPAKTFDNDMSQSSRHPVQPSEASPNTDADAYHGRRPPPLSLSNLGKVVKPPFFPPTASSSSGDGDGDGDGGSSAAGGIDHNGFLSALLQLANIPPPGMTSAGADGAAEGGDGDGFSLPSLASLFSAGLGGDTFSRLFGNFTDEPASDDDDFDGQHAEDDDDVAAADGEGKVTAGDGAPGTIDDPAFFPPGAEDGDNASSKRPAGPASSATPGLRRRPLPASADPRDRLKFRFDGPLSFLTVFSFSAFIVEMLNHALGVRPGGSQLGQNVVRAFSAGEDSKWRRFEEEEWLLAAEQQRRAGGAAAAAGRAAGFYEPPALLPPADYANAVTRALLSLVKAWQSGGEFYECAWRLFCEDLNDSFQVPGTPGVLARINSVGMRVGFGALRPKDMPAALMRSFMGENRPLKCNRLFQGCPEAIGRREIYDKMRQLRIHQGRKPEKTPAE